MFGNIFDKEKGKIKKIRVNIWLVKGMWSSFLDCLDLIIEYELAKGLCFIWWEVSIDFKNFGRRLRIPKGKGFVEVGISSMVSKNRIDEIRWIMKGPRKII